MKTPEPIDLDDEDIKAWIAEMRDSRPTTAERHKISDWKYYHRHREERLKANREWRETHAERYAKKQKEYHDKPTILKRKRESARIRYHTDPEWREATLARQRERYHAMTPEQKAEYTRKQCERARIRRAKAAKETT